MKVNTKQVLKGLDGKVLKDRDGDKETEATLKTAIVNALLSIVQGEKGTEKVKKYELAKKVFNSDEVDLDENNIKLIKDRVGDVFPPLIVGQINDMLKV